MGMRINTGSGIDPGLVDKLIEMERLPIKQIEERKKKVSEDQKGYKDLTALVSSLGQSLNSLRNRTDFVKLKVESSHPDIVDGTVDNSALPGQYEVEVLHLARTHKSLAEAFPDKDETPVGFGYMSIEVDGKTFDVDIDPDKSTLAQVAATINETVEGAKAIVVNTKENIETGEDSFRLLVLSEKSGKQAKVTIDPDTTYLEFKDQVVGRNLEMSFEDVPVFDEDNSVEAVMPGLVMNAKRAEPGTKVTIKIDYDLEKTFESITGFIDNYNKVNEFVDKQFQVDPQTNQAGALSKDNTLKTLRRSLQNAMQYRGNGKIQTLAEVGITTDPKTGALKLDETKVKKALADDYIGVANLFTQNAEGPGFGATMGDAVRSVQNPRYGVLPSKEREFTRMIENFDKDIERRERNASQRAEGIKRKFAALEGLVSGMKAQGQGLAQNLGGGGVLPGM
ncbi:MAG: flagellar filament capping protein FliD [Silvanigrellales bacterium]|jgi:flagellar hook-associated protein 2|nr:flagellar filament capping protein FliD [Silvanigrellales bacterium]